jgi:hypothetical protein
VDEAAFAVFSLIQRKVILGLGQGSIAKHADLSAQASNSDLGINVSRPFRITRSSGWTWRSKKSRETPSESAASVFRNATLLPLDGV